MNNERPDVIVHQSNNNLGRVSPEESGTSVLIVTGVAVANVLTLNQVLGPFYSLDDVEAAGITESYDTANKILAHEHARAFYQGAGNGTKLYMYLQEATKLYSELLDENGEDFTAIISKTRDAKIFIVTRVPQDGYAPAYEGQFDSDIVAAIPKAQALRNKWYNAPFHHSFQIILEGYAWQGTPNLTYDFATLDSNRVSVVTGNDYDVAHRDVSGEFPYLKYAFAGYLGGVRAGLAVNVSAGRVKNGALPIERVGLSDGRAIDDLTPIELNLLNKFRMIFAWIHPPKAGFYFNDDHTCTAFNDDYAYSPAGRVADKAAGITREVYIEELLDDIEIDEDTGGLPPGVAKAFQERLSSVLTEKMATSPNKEVSKFNVYVDPKQNILSTDEIVSETFILPKGTKRRIIVKQSFINTFNS